MSGVGRASDIGDIRILAGLLLAVAAPSAASIAPPRPYPVEERSIAQLDEDLAAGRVTSQGLVAAYLARIARIDKAGPALDSIIALNPEAMAQARALDAERGRGHVRGPLHGIPILIKDNIETLDPLPTTAGSLALVGNVTHRDAPVVARLRAAGAIILGKTNLSEWANARSGDATSGWSAVGGLTRNPYALNRNPCGSSAGSGAAAAASLAAAALGTETDGSITCPSSVDGLVGLKPTVGLVSRSRIVPIAHSQDTAGPMGRSVRDVATLLQAMAGGDPADPATAGADAHRRDYAAALDPEALRGKRIGVMRFAAGFDARVDALFAAAIATIRAAGATIVEIPAFEHGKIGDLETQVIQTELKGDLNAYLATTPASVRTRTLADLIAFNRAHAEQELSWFGQDAFEKSEATTGAADPAYREALSAAKRMAGSEGIDRLLAQGRLDALIAPTTGPAWVSDLVDGDHYSGGGAGSIAAVAGYPHLTVPMGQIHGLPVGLSFIGPAWSDGLLLSLGNAYELRSRMRRPPTYRRELR